ncbi:hypothetical protein [Tautonia plasticadhaerens]|uniref:Uncharacterized protein n=1 Tax=Tautonia plasticadhaerens TaxID=2527974 RepID=A0A518H873_9BACT|nr:hypothetical protein [Tautonia plasticadhaerens]QDV37050.1 hypothetical protein ElP_49830 [Tautonia plasticadhaerens]
MESPQIRPGSVPEAANDPRVLAYFRNSAQGNLAVQLVVGLGARADRLGVTAPDQIEGNQGMLLSIPCPDPALLDRVSTLCRDLGAEVHRRRG